MIPTVEASRQNILQTYDGLAMAVPGTQRNLSPEFAAYAGESSVPFCNFAAAFNFDPSEAGAVLRRLRELAEPEPRFTVFSLSGDRPATLHDHLVQGGFRVSNSLDQMVSDRLMQEPAAPLKEATSESHRRAVATMVVEIFFSHAAQWIRDQTIDCTANSPHRLFWTDVDGRPAGCVMLVESPSALGLYSLGVLRPFRGFGLGKQIIRACRDISEAKNLPLILQCADNLTPWYQRCGFRKLGFVHAYSLIEY